MSLQVWLPMTKDLRQQGLSDVTVVNNGATFNSSGKLGGCYQFGTAASGIEIPKTSMTSFSEASVSFWVKILSWNTSYCTLFQAGTSSRNWVDYIFGILRNGTNSTLCFTIGNTSSTTTNACQTSTLNLNEWYHMTFTYKSDKMKIYLNGNLDKEYTTSYVPTFNKITKISLGRANDSQYQSNCLMNDIRIYDHCLSPMEIKRISQGLVLHYPLNRMGFGQENFILESHKVISGGQASGITRTYENDGSMKIVASSGNGTWCSLGFAKNSNTNVGNNMTVGDTYCISCDVKVESGTVLPTLFINNGNSYKQLKPVNGSIITNKWMRIYYSSTWADPGTSSYGNISLHLGFNSAIGTYYFKNFKLEKGSIPTPWSPAPSDDLAIQMGLNSNIEYDTSGYCNNGTRTGTFDWTSDTPKYTVSTNITPNSNIQFTPMLAGAYSWTVAAWIKPTVANNDGKAWFSVEQNTYWQVTCYSNQLGIRDNSIGGTGTRKNYSFGTIAANTWVHLVATYDNGTLKLYNNGVLQSTNTVGGTYLNAMNNGRWGSAVQDGYYWNGQISDARIYATALSADDVKSLYQNSAYIDSSGNVYGTIHEV